MEEHGFFSLCPPWKLGATEDFVQLLQWGRDFLLTPLRAEVEVCMVSPEEFQSDVQQTVLLMRICEIIMLLLPALHIHQYLTSLTRPTIQCADHKSSL